MTDSTSDNDSLYHSAWEAPNGHLLSTQLLAELNKELTDMTAQGVGTVSSWLMEFLPNGPPTKPEEVATVPTVPVAEFLHIQRSPDVVTGIVPHLTAQQAIAASLKSGNAGTVSGSLTPAKCKPPRLNAAAQQQALIQPRHLQGAGLPYKACKNWSRSGACAALIAGRR